MAGLSKMFIPGHRFEIFSLTPSDVYKKNVLLSACGFQPFTPEKQRHRWVQHVRSNMYGLSLSLGI